MIGLTVIIKGAHSKLRRWPTASAAGLGGRDQSCNLGEVKRVSLLGKGSDGTVALNNVAYKQEIGRLGEGGRRSKRGTVCLALPVQGAPAPNYRAGVGGPRGSPEPAQPQGGPGLQPSGLPRSPRYSLRVSR